MTVENEKPTAKAEAPAASLAGEPVTKDTNLVQWFRDNGIEVFDADDPDSMKRFDEKLKGIMSKEDHVFRME